MTAPSAEELAAIAAAYLVVARGDDAPQQQAQASRWAVAGRLSVDDAQGARFTVRGESRWSAAGRVDG